MGKPEDILKRNRERSRRRAREGDKPENATGVLDRIIYGSMFLALWGAALLLVVIVFAVTTFAGTVLFNSFTTGLILGVVVTFGTGYVLYKLGSYF